MVRKRQCIDCTCDPVILITLSPAPAPAPAPAPLLHHYLRLIKQVQEEKQRETLSLVKMPSLLNLRLVHGTQTKNISTPLSIDLKYVVLFQNSSRAHRKPLQFCLTLCFRAYGVYHLIASCIHGGYHYTAIAREGNVCRM